MSGFFALRRDVLQPAVPQHLEHRVQILVDLVASSPRPLRVMELPYEFRNRFAGESKLDSQAVWGYLMLLADKLVGHIVPVRFIAFTLVGIVGVFAHFAILTLLFRGVSMSFPLSQGIATGVAMTGDFALNNALTYRDMRLKGWRWFGGWRRSRWSARSAHSPMSASRPISSRRTRSGWLRHWPES